MDGQLPSLNGLRAFEAVARRLSIKDAAQELYVTPGAVSQQLKNLEEQLNCVLVLRKGRSVTLTEEGSYLYPALREAFRQIENATESLMRPTRQILSVTVLPSFATRWLVPRLGQFQKRHPDIDVRISADIRPVDLVAERFDLGIRFGLGQYRGFESDWLMADELFPVCSPELLANGPSLDRPEDLAHHTLLHDDSPRRWKLWKEAMGLAGLNSKAGITFNDASMVVDAAVAGQGVALGRRSLVETELKAGRLVRLWDKAVPHDLAYYLVYPKQTMDRPAAAAFRQWLLDTAQQGL